MKKQRLQRAGSMTEDQFWACVSKSRKSNGRGVNSAFRVLVNGESAMAVAEDIGVSVTCVNQGVFRVSQRHDRNIAAYGVEKQITPVFLSGNDDLMEAKRRKKERALLPTPATSLSLSALLGCE